MPKKTYALLMSYDVSNAEKTRAEKALIYFGATLKTLQQASDYLNLMKTPFKDNPDIKPEDIMKARAAIRRFRDKAIDNFNRFKQDAFKCVDAMRLFASDSQIIKLMKSFITTIDGLEVQVNDFADLFADLESKDFPKQVVETTEAIQKTCEEIEEIVNERIKDHVQNNILATNWVDSISNNLQTKIEQKTPLIMDLFNKRQDQLNNIVKERTTLGN